MAVDLRRIRERVMGSRGGRREARRMAPKSRQKVVRRRGHPALEHQLTSFAAALALSGGTIGIAGHKHNVASECKPSVTVKAFRKPT